MLVKPVGAVVWVGLIFVPRQTGCWQCLAQRLRGNREVATAMELAPCGLGGGNSDLFAKAAGCNYHAESSVGEFALGSQPKA